MFTIKLNVKGEPIIVTDNVQIADLIAEERDNEDHSKGNLGTPPVFFTGGPNAEVAQGLAEGMAAMFDEEAAIWGNKDGTWSARFR